MSDADERARIRAYLEQHRATYDRAALRRKLIDDGFDPANVDAALADIDATTAPASDPDAARATGAMLAAGAATALLNAGICLAGFQGVGLTPLLIGVLLELVAIGTLWRRRPMIARGMSWGILIWLLLTIALIALILFQLQAG